MGDGVTGPPTETWAPGVTGRSTGDELHFTGVEAEVLWGEDIYKLSGLLSSAGAPRWPAWVASSSGPVTKRGL
jgi:hypothetical protein